MQEKDLKTSTKQRILIAVIAILMLGATVAIYISIILNANSSDSTSNPQVDEALVAELTEQYSAKNAEYEAASDKLSSKYLEKFINYRSEINSFNAASANENQTVKTKDLKVGSGKELSSDSTGYGAYYIGWCADESIFDSSFDDFDSPSKLKAPLIVEKDYLIEGWYLGVAGMKLGGVRVVTIPGSLAYGDSQEICGGKNSPLKFLIMPVEVNDEFINLSDETSELYMRLLYAQYGMEYTEE